MEKKRPTFSIILETENLETANIEGLHHALASLQEQDISPREAEEIILIDTGDTPGPFIKKLTENYPWLSIHQAPKNITYYQAKMLGAEIATGEIIVYFDSDCLYEPNWLRMILTAFVEASDRNIIAGETQTQGKGPYGTAMGLTYIFPQFSEEKNISRTSQYFLNNVAFRRNFLLKNPIPVELPLYRGNCAIHAHHLKQTGHPIWKQPQARAHHAPPASLSHFFWRFLLIGYDYYWQKEILKQEKQNPTPNNPSIELMPGLKGKLKILDDRVGKMFRKNPRHILYLPLALPIVLAALSLIILGYWLTVFKPHFLLDTYQTPLEKQEKQKNRRATKNLGINSP